MQRRSAILAAGASSLALLASGAPASAQEEGSATVTELVVTAQRRAEALQDVPIAVSAFSQETLQARRLDGAENLQLAIPNVSFSRTNFGGYNFQIRGIGSKLIAAGADAATSIHVNSAPVGSARFADAEFYDVERLEVLRGPQGTLYGRNATGGTVNLITAKPSGVFEGAVTADLGAYDGRRLKGFINLPIAGDKLDLRLAGMLLKRDGFVTNTLNDTDIDGRDLWSTRVTLGFAPNERVRGFAMWERFEENDDRARVGKQLCIKDTGPASIGGVPTTPVSRGFLSQGCQAGSVYGDAAFGTANSQGTLDGVFGYLAGLIERDAYEGKRQSRDLREVESALDPRYRAKQDLYQLSLDIDIAEGLTLSSLTSKLESSGFSFLDYVRAAPTVTFNAVPGLTDAAGSFEDPQLGLVNSVRTYDQTSNESEEWSQELRLYSDFAGPLNFSLGGLYLKTEQENEYYVFGASQTALARLLNLAGSNPPIYVDPLREPDGTGHHYYFTRSGFSLESKAVFGELYWQPRDDLRLTGGLRHTRDRKGLTAYPLQMMEPGRGSPPAAVQPEPVELKATTGRLNIDWKPDLAFTDQTMVYGSYSRGYKGGGFNSPNAVGTAGISRTFSPEYVNAYEIGTKNTLLGGRMQLNASAFYYDYQGYQINKVANFTLSTENIDAKVRGAEMEAIWEPLDGLKLNANLGYLDTEAVGGESVDLLDRTQGDPSLAVVKDFNGNNCTARVDDLAFLQSLINGGVIGPDTLLALCSGGLAGLGVLPASDVSVSLDGNRLPNAPKWTVALGAQYEWSLTSDWSALARVDFYNQTSAFARVFNAEADRIKGWRNTNVSLNFSNEALNLFVQIYVKNLFDDDAITDLYLTDDSSGLYTNIFTLDPRTYGVAVTKKF